MVKINKTNLAKGLKVEDNRNSITISFEIAKDNKNLPKEDDPLSLFISYRTESEDKVKVLKQNLEKRGVVVFVADQDLRLSEQWEPQLEDAIAKCDALCSFIEKGYTNSPWCNQEIGYAKALDKQLIPIITRSGKFGKLLKESEMKGFLGRIEGKCYNLQFNKENKPANDGNYLICASDIIAALQKVRKESCRL